MSKDLAHSLALSAFVELCDGLPRVLACAKSVDLQYAYANKAFAERAGCKRVGDVVGRSAKDLFPIELAELYEAQDLRVLASGKPLQDQLELIATGTGPRYWCVSSKSRLLGDDGRVLGVLSLSIDVGGFDERSTRSDPSLLAGVVDHVRSHLADPLRIGELAARSGLTVAKFERQVRRTFGLAPAQFIQRLRLEDAMHRLSHSDEAIASVAANCGFYDQASFTRQFRSATGLTPGAYRNTHPFRST